MKRMFLQILQDKRKQHLQPDLVRCAVRVNCDRKVLPVSGCDLTSPLDSLRERATQLI